MLTTAVENYPGFRDGILGPDLMEEMRVQAERFGATFVQGDVTRLDLSQRPFRISVGKTEYTTADAVILPPAHRPSGSTSASTSSCRAGRVSTCATCDGFFFKGRDVAIVGGGDTAMEEAIYLSKLASSVTVIHRRDTLRASKVMQDKRARSPTSSGSGTPRSSTSRTSRRAK
jgi:thioredoxin reductase (NADPH)